MCKIKKARVNLQKRNEDKWVLVKEAGLEQDLARGSNYTETETRAFPYLSS